MVIPVGTDDIIIKIGSPQLHLYTDPLRKTVSKKQRTLEVMHKIYCDPQQGFPEEMGERLQER